MCKGRAFHRNWSHHHANKFRRFEEHPGKKMWKENFKAMFNYPLANVQELDDQYELHLYAPGLEKSDFLIAIIDQTLSISVEKEFKTEGKWKRQEFVPKGFTRQFELNEKVDKAGIAAKYESGVLIVTLPKLEGFETARQEIHIA